MLTGVLNQIFCPRCTPVPSGTIEFGYMKLMRAEGLVVWNMQYGANLIDMSRAESIPHTIEALFQEGAPRVCVQSCALLLSLTASQPEPEP